MSFSFERRSNHERAALLGWAALVVLCVVYGPIAIEYMWRFFIPSAPGLWDHTFAAVAGDDKALGHGTIHYNQHAAYEQSRVALLVHTVTGGIAIMLGVLQFWQGLRRRHLRVHRAMGRIQATLVVISMPAAAIYLINTGPDGTFDGPAFYMQLWALALGTFAATIAGVVLIIRRRRSAHGVLMALSFSMLLTAPLLRVFYLLLGVAWPDVTQEVTNLAGAAMLQVLAIGGGIVASRRFDDRPQDAAPSLPHLSERLRMVWFGLAGVSSVVVGAVFVHSGGQMNRIIGSYVFVLIAAAVIIRVTRAHALRDGRRIAVSEWTVHEFTLWSTPLLTGVFWAIFALFFDTFPAFYAALLVGSAIPLGIGLALVGFARGRRAAVPRRVVDVAVVG